MDASPAVFTLMSFIAALAIVTFVFGASAIVARDGDPDRNVR